jgi:hypothetical protein
LGLKFVFIELIISLKTIITFAKKTVMIIEVKEITAENIDRLLNKIKKQRKQTIAKHFSKLKRGIDGLEYQKSIRNEWN